MADKSALVTLKHNGVSAVNVTVTLKGGLAPVPVPPPPVIRLEPSS